MYIRTHFWEMLEFVSEMTLYAIIISVFEVCYNKCRRMSGYDMGKRDDAHWYIVVRYSTGYIDSYTVYVEVITEKYYIYYILSRSLRASRVRNDLVKIEG